MPPKCYIETATCYLLVIRLYSDIESHAAVLKPHIFIFIGSPLTDRKLQKNCKWQVCEHLHFKCRTAKQVPMKLDHQACNHRRRESKYMYNSLFDFFIKKALIKNMKEIQHDYHVSHSYHLLLRELSRNVQGLHMNTIMSWLSNCIGDISTYGQTK